ncbi:DUF1553 domain-containing protein [Algisphaera agarilytica]|uniref:DUF1553 domain-containing protein n=1 Tax=Algisphaera agarilytica TaxID=1385975 RepID=UPI00161A6B62|nr:DUF1553 domain-containing protein [Algisphaera agarilytica]
MLCLLLAVAAVPLVMWGTQRERSQVRTAVGWKGGSPATEASREGIAITPAANNQPPAQKGQVRFNRDIRPLISDNCFHCHGPDSGTREAGLRLDTHEDLLRDLGGRFAVVPGKPEQSELYKRIIATDADEIMPPPKSHKHLNAEQIDLFRRWIEEGAQWEDHWSFEPVEQPLLPDVSRPEWVENPIDAFILSRLDSEGLSPNDHVDRYTLVRRVSFDLRGLPPTPEEIAAFVGDESEDAYEKMVDRFLASPKYGEHRARYWLDAARYADTHGFHYDNFRNIWPYRDWVVKAYNDNMPFDQFTVEQIAGDMLPNPTQSQRVATGFNRNNPTTNEGGVIPDEYLAIYALDRVEATTTTWLGLTASCASCHDHKFDPVSQKEFYQFAAFFRNTTQPALDGNRANSKPVISVFEAEDQPRVKEIEARLGDIRQEVAQTVGDAWRFEQGVDWLGADALSVRLEDLFDSSEPAEAVASETAAEPVESSEATELAEPTAPEAQLPRLATTEVLGQDAIEIGPDTYLELGDFGNLSRDEAFTISFWAYVPKEGGLPADKVLFGRYDQDNHGQGWQVRLLRNKWIEVRLASGDNQHDVVTAKLKSWGGVIRQGEWNHVALNYHPLDQSRVVINHDSSPGLQIYIHGNIPNGPNRGSSHMLKGDFAVDKPLVIGDRSATVEAEGESEAKEAKPYEGPKAGLREVRVFNRALSTTELKLLANALTPEERRGEAAKPTEVSGEAAEVAAENAEGSEPEFKHEAVAGLLAEASALESELAVMRAYAPVTMVMEEKADSEPFAHVLERGLYDKLGERVTAGVPEALPPLPEGESANRLGLARWIVDEDNPLTARVTINRFWQEIFGAGLVETTEDFGSQGSPPTHPELLDWLAHEFVASGWDVKHIYKLMLMSSTYRQSSKVRPEVLKVDPENRLLARGARFRFDAEVIRDQALWLSTLLVEDMGGPPVKPYQPAGLWKTVAYPNSNTGVFKADTGDKLYRRSLYTMWKRTSPPPAMMIFDAPDREHCRVRRERTNTPLQALVLMNDPQFVEAARHLAQVVMHTESDDRFALIYTKAMGKAPSDKARGVLEDTFNQLHAIYQEDPESAKKLLAVGDSPVDETLDPVDLATWTMIANQVMNMDAFINKN